MMFTGSNANQSPCLICNDRRATDILNSVRQLQSAVSFVSLNYSMCPHFNWNLYNNSCRYGLRCDKVDKAISQANRELSSLEPKLVEVAINGDSSTYQRVLSIIRGSYPSVYNQLEYIRRTTRKS